MNKNELLDLFKEIGVLKTGHFRLTSGLHSEYYLQCATIFENPRIAEKIIAQLQPILPPDVTTVVAPAIGGITMGYEVARLLGARSIFAERQDGVMTLRRGFSLSPDEKVLVAEDVVTTGGSVKEVLEIVRFHGCEIVGVTSVVDRSNGKVDFGVPFYPLIKNGGSNLTQEECPLCAQNIPITKPGSR